ncbi:peptide-methionine (S)-S-oxide reductase MsrA [Kordiimonas gwangyangensis]|uniref:peptide-methionine (S)-S-oxide reductase MsrA n=1 Tax=Kordiimonas gwangyangensis TaxID=288022 RepID=UPI0003721F62|nr:peptide-methionine (S)-S-oxide reductase MsrA [Kordiimonas gwangyangensis]
MAIATFGAGCFWGVEETFRTTEGVTDTAVGYMGGTTEKPTYEEVCTDKTGHAEVVQVTYDPDVVSYDALVDIFFDNHNPTELNRQGPDVGTQYRSAVFYEDEGQKEVAEAKKAALQASGRFKRDIVTEIVPVQTFWAAEEYHQQYLLKRGMTSCHI